MVCHGELNISQLSALVKAMGGELVGFVDEKQGINLNEADLQGLMEAEANGRGTEKQETSL